MPANQKYWINPDCRGRFWVYSNIMTTQLQYVKLAQSLPPRLTRFFARYPPPGLLSPSNSFSNPITSLSDTDHATSSTSPNDSSAVPETNQSSLPSLNEIVNPFRSQQHPVTGKWHDPVYSLRRQAELVKLARHYGVEELLPFTVKGTEERLRKREENGLRVKGTGVGQKVKGKAWERTLKGRLERRKQAMLEMPKMIQTWKEVCSRHAMPFCAKLTYMLQPEGTWSWMEEISKMISMVMDPGLMDMSLPSVPSLFCLKHRHGRKRTQYCKGVQVISGANCVIYYRDWCCLSHIRKDHLNFASSMVYKDCNLRAII